MIDLSGKHIFIAGGSRGIGAATALLAARLGASVSVNYLNGSEAAEKLCEQMRSGANSSNKRFLSIKADVAVDGAMDYAIDKAVAELGPLSGLVVSAGVFEGLPIEQMTVEFWDRVMAINVRGTFLAVRAAARHMRGRGDGGSVVIYTSTAGQRGSAVYSAYAASKAAQTLFMRSMALELASDRIRVNCIAPAWTETDMAAPSLDAIGRDKVAAGFPLGRIGLPEDVANATCFLLSASAEFITGSTITVDGGMDMRG